MNKIIFSASVLSGMVVSAQVGINTDTPKATLHVVSRVTDPTRPQGVVLPHATSQQIRDWVGVEEGTLIYNITEKCVQSFNGVSWDNLGGCGTHNVPGKATAITKIPLPARVSLENSGYYIASIYDEDYLPYTKDTGEAAFGFHNPQGTRIVSPYESTIDVPGKLDTTGIEVGIPVVATYGANITIPSISIKAIVPAEKTENNRNTEIELFFPGDTFIYGDSGTQRRYTIAKLRAVTNTLEVKKLDMNIGNGADYRGIQLAEFSYYKDNKYTIESKFDFRVVTGIPDKNFSVPQGTESGTAYNGQYLHKFIYVPAYGLDGKVWLNNNLGANYSNVNSPVFSPGKQASSPTDFNAYGSLFRSGHNAYNTSHLLGHELVKWTNATMGAPEISSLSWNHSHYPPNYASKFTEYCPDGFKTPTANDWIRYGNVLAQTTSGLANNEFWNDFSLRLSTAGYRNIYNGTLFNEQSARGYYWSSTIYYDVTGVYTNGVFRRHFNSEYTTVSNDSIFNGYSIRCIKD